MEMLSKVELINKFKEYGNNPHMLHDEPNGIHYTIKYEEARFLVTMRSPHIAKTALRFGHEFVSRVVPTPPKASWTLEAFMLEDVINVILEMRRLN